MGDPKGFIKHGRKDAGNRPVLERILDFTEVEQTLNTEDRILQASRCMDCGVPFCHWACPVMSIIPEWQDAEFHGDWLKAAAILQSTNDFPEFTGRICPAPCEKSCTLNLHDAPVTIRENEVAIIERMFNEGYMKPKPPAIRTGRKVAVIGSGPAGLSAAAQLNKRGHEVTVYEKDEAVGGLLRFGIPDFKLQKHVIDRRISLMKQEGITFIVNTEAGKDISAQDLLEKYDAVCLAVGAMKPRNLPLEGRQLQGVHFAMEFLTQQNLVLRGKEIPAEKRISAKGKKVLVIGGGDTGSDCVGTSIRQGAEKVMQIEIMPQPPSHKNPRTPWPYYPNIMKTSSSHEEGCERSWGLSSKRFIGEHGVVKKVEVIKVDCHIDDITGNVSFSEVTGSSYIIDADLVLLAMGFTQPVHDGLLDALKVPYDNRGNVQTTNGKSATDKIFAAGDATSGASLVVRAIYSGRTAAIAIDDYLK